MSGDPPVNRPTVARVTRPISTAAVATTLTAVGICIFLWLASARAAHAERESILPPLASATVTNPTPLPTAVEPPVPPHALSPPFIPTPAPSYSYGPSDADNRAQAALRSPVLIVDLAQADPRAQQLPPGEAIVPNPESSKSLSDTERFSARIGGEQVEVAEAERLTGLSRLIPQGAIIGAVMETALNSDLPGFARAIVQRDVLSFDGSAVLIPAGSRVIGQYKSGVAQGASRVFILWTRIIRPDGVSISLGSPAIDDLGRGGVAGKVNRHFFQRFGGAILLSVLTGGINAAAASAGGGSTVIVGSAGQASSLANQASGDLDIPPTITTPQGASVRIFVARDLDFTRVGPTK